MSFFEDIFSPVESVTKFAPDRFRATVMNGLGLSSASRFEVELPSINGMAKVSGGKVKDKSTSDDRNLLCVAATIPGVSIGTVQRQHTMEPKMMANSYTNNECTTTFYLTNTYVMREYFERWMQCIVMRGEMRHETEKNLAGFYKGPGGQGYQRDIRIRQYSRNARRSYTAHLKDAFPTSISNIELNSQLQGQASEFTVTWSYRMSWNEQHKAGIVQG